MATVTLVSDSFNRADGPVGAADTGQTWLHSGTRQVEVASNVCVGGSAGAQQDTSYIDCGEADFEITAKLWLGDQGDLQELFCGLVWRLTDENNYYHVLLAYESGTTYRFYGYKHVAGNWLEMTGSPKTITASPGGWLECKIVASGTNSKVYIGETLHYDNTDEFNATATKVGVWLPSENGKIDDFLVTHEVADVATTGGRRGGGSAFVFARRPRRYQTIVVGDVAITTRRRA